MSSDDKSSETKNNAKDTKKGQKSENANKVQHSDIQLLMQSKKEMKKVESSYLNFSESAAAEATKKDTKDKDGSKGTELSTDE